MKLSEKIIVLRNRNKMSQGDLAEKLNVSRQSVSKWETGASTPDLDKLIAMSELFQVTMDELTKDCIELDSKETEASKEQSIVVDTLTLDCVVKGSKWILKIIGGLMILLSSTIFIILASLGVHSIGMLLIPGFFFFSGLTCIFSNKKLVPRILFFAIGIVVIWLFLALTPYQ